MKIVVQYKTHYKQEGGEGPTKTQVFSPKTTLAEVIDWERKEERSASYSGSSLVRCSDILIIGVKEEEDKIHFKEI